MTTVKQSGLSSLSSLHSHTPTLEPEAYHGVVGDIVKAIDPHTESDPAAILMQTLVGIGNVIGRTAHFRVEGDVHYLNLFLVLVGNTAKGRKGTSWGQVKRILSELDPEWVDKSIVNGLSSGEGLIHAVRDSITESQPIKRGGRVEDYEDVIVDPGVQDKRLLVVEAEFARVLQVCERSTNTLSAIIRDAWDGGNLRTMTKSNAASASGAHISIIGHITSTELLRMLNETQSANGFGNRFLWASVQRSKLLPEGGLFHEQSINHFVDRLARVVEFAKAGREIRLDDAARSLWHTIYEKLSEPSPGLVGALTSRSEPQTMRLATLYAVLDCSKTITQQHLLAALAVWNYCQSSAHNIFGDALGDPISDTIISALKSSGPMTRLDISNVFGRHKNKAQLDQAFERLRKAGLIERHQLETGGRPAEVWRATAREESERSEERGGVAA